MNEARQKKLLLSVDGSERAMEMVRYIGSFKPLHRMQIVLFSVQNKIPEFFWDQKRGSHFDWRTGGVKVWEKEQERGLKQYVEEAREILLGSGFPHDHVKTRIHERRVGIARDILAEAQQGYSAVAVARRGRSKLQGLFLGSTTTKLLDTLSDMPLLVVGRHPLPGKVLLAVDNSRDAMKAVDFVAETLGGDGITVTLMHVIREAEAVETEFPPGSTEPYVEEDKEIVEKVFDDARQRLTAWGFQPDQIATKVVTGAYSRAGVIMDKARQDGYGTIVVGRRGLSRVQEFFMGRVSNKLIQMGREQAVWVIG